jgi:hypothetical protein
MLFLSREREERLPDSLSDLQPIGIAAYAGKVKYLAFLAVC